MRAVWFQPAPPADLVPARMPSPFDARSPHSLALRAARDLQRRLSAAPDQCGGWGKMFGVLVVRSGDGRIGYLSAFSGTLGGRWSVDGFAPPLFDVAERDQYWPEEEAGLDRLTARIADAEAQLAEACLRLDEVQTAQHVEAAALTARHRERRSARHARRASPGADEHALAQESRADKAERRRLLAEQASTRAPDERGVRDARARANRLVTERSSRSAGLLRRLQAGYRITSCAGGSSSLAAVFAPEQVPGGAGDCAAPKLVAWAQRLGLRPLALTEFWWGASPEAGGRHHGTHYAACRGRCGPLLGFMLEGLDVEPAPLFGAQAVGAEHPRTQYEDEWLAIVQKPAGLLSVPGRSRHLQDSVLTRLLVRYAVRPTLVHRLDLDTSGVLVVAKDAETHVALQRLFVERTLEKIYVAWLDGVVAAEQGAIDLALRGDPHDRPRQIHDPERGRATLTQWRVLERTGGRTRVELRPRTGRTHQLRLHAAHPEGLNAPIVGDRLYGRRAAAEPRMLLHAESIAFVHPRTEQPLHVRWPAPF